MAFDRAVILAGGESKRFAGGIRKELADLCGRTLIERVYSAVKRATASEPLIVCGPDGDLIREKLPDAQYVYQPMPDGTVDALRLAMATVDDVNGNVLVTYGCCSYFGQDGLSAIEKELDKSAFVTAVNCGNHTEAGAFAFRIEALRTLLLQRPEIRDIERLLLDSRDASEVGIDCGRMVTGREVLAVERLRIYGRTVRGMMEKGVDFIDPDAVYIDDSVTIERGAVIWPGVTIGGDSHIGENTVIYPGCQISDTNIGSDCTLRSVVADNAVIGDGVKIGPFVNIRPGTVIADGCKVGDFVEIKNSNIGKGTKLPHLSYIGDADVGERVNVGCGSVFVNYDGFKKHRTTVGNDVFIGCQTNLVAPVSVGDDAYTAAGSTITENVPKGALAISRARQVTKEGWVEKYRAIKRKRT